MLSFGEAVRNDWLQSFVHYASFGEASPRLMHWVGVSTIAGALQRKVWIDQGDFQWSPNFYILIVGEPGAVRKTTSIDVGMRLLKRVEGINFGPSSTTWQAFVERVALAYSKVDVPGHGEFEMSSLTLALSEFGTFFDPENRDLVDVLTELWDGRLDTFQKDTKTSGKDDVVNPWINIIGATTPKWFARNFGDNLVGTGFASRLIVLAGELPVKDIAYPKRHMPATRPLMAEALIERLAEISRYAGEVQLTEEAYEWGDAWYTKERDALRACGFGSLESGFMIRKQGHLHKLATVLMASRGDWPVIDVQHLVDAAEQLASLEGDARTVFGVVGQTKITAATRDIVAAVEAAGTIEKHVLYRKQFMRTMDWGEFEAAVKSAVQARLIYEADNVAQPLLVARKL